MIVVSDTSPLINLAMIGQLDLLRQLYGRVIIPQSVYQEIVVAGQGQAGATEIQTLHWIEMQSVLNYALVVSLQLDIDVGEAEAITLAIELKADLLLMDERKGREVATRLGVDLIGLLGILIQAKQKRLIPAVKPLMDALMAKANFWINQSLYQQVLQTVNE